MVVVAGVACAYDLLDHGLHLAGEEGELCTDYLSDICHAEHFDLTVPLCDLDGMGLHGVESQFSELAHGEDKEDVSEVDS